MKDKANGFPVKVPYGGSVCKVFRQKILKVRETFRRFGREAELNIKKNKIKLRRRSVFIANKIRTGATTEETITFDRFQTNANSDESDNVVDERQTKSSYNFKGTSGNLEPGYGFSVLKLPETETTVTTREIEIYEQSPILDLWHFRYYDESTNKPQERLFWFNADGYLAYCKVFSYDPSSYEINDLEPIPNPPTGLNLTINDVDYMIFSHDNGVVKITQNTKTIKNDLPLKKFVSMANAYGGVYAINEGKRNKITYSNDQPDPTEWTLLENTLDLTDERGRCNKLMFFDDYLFAFRDYGITKISKYSASDDFSTSNLFQTSAKIYPNTVAKCGDFVVFMAKDGIYNFNGQTTKKFDFDINKLLNVNDNSNATACYQNGKYFLACKLNFDDNQKIGAEAYADGFVNNTLIIIDLNTNQLTITRGVDIRSMLSLNSGNLSTVVACFNGEHSHKLGMLDNSGKLFDTALESSWKSVKIDLDRPEINKVLKEIYIKTSQATTLKITTDSTESEIQINAKQTLQKIKTNISGKEFQFELISSNNPKIEIFKAKFRSKKSN